jgi:hypothetical protein
MAEQVLTNAHLTVNGVNLSDHVRSITLRYAAELQDITAMGDSSRARLGGLKDWSFEVEFNQDYAAASVDATLFPIVGTSVAIIIRADAGAVSATNPNFTGNAILESYQPVGGGVGGTHVAPVTFQGNGTLTRATS